MPIRHLTLCIDDCIYNKVPAVEIAYNLGHQVASGTWSNPDLTSLTKDEITLEFTRIQGNIILMHNQSYMLRRSEDAIRKITGASVAMTRPRKLLPWH